MIFFLFELKNRLFLIIIGTIITLLLSFYYRKTLIYIFIKPTFFFKQQTHYIYFIYTNLPELFFTYLQVTFFFSLHAFIILATIQLSFFFNPGLYKHEKKKLFSLLITNLFFFILFVFFMYFFLFPLNWLLFSDKANNKNSSKTDELDIFLETKLNEYVSFFTGTYFLFFCLSQIIIFIYLKLNLLYSNNKQMFARKQFRSVFYLFFFLLATVTTPPDIVSQLLLGCILISLFELSLFTIVIKNVKKTFITQIPE